MSVPRRRLRLWLVAAALMAVAAPACRAQTQAGLDEFRAGRFAEAMADWQAAAETGDATGALYAGVLYDTGVGVPQDRGAALAWYRRAAEAGSAAGAFNLAVLFDAGVGVARDTAEAARWYGRAAAQDFPRAEYNLALLYEQGDGVAADRRQAMQLYRRAAAHGLTAAQAHLRALGQAMPVLRRAAAADPAMLQFEQAQRLLLARGAGEASAAAALLRQSAEKGNALAEYDLAYCYEHGIGVAADPVRALEWYQRAADHSQGQAVHAIAMAALHGAQDGMRQATLQPAEPHRTR